MVLTPLPSRLHRQGFTLLELVVVMLVLATLFAVAAPRFSDFTQGRTLSEETRRLVALTRFARSEAIARSARMQLWIAPQRNSYGLRAETASIPSTTQSSQTSQEDQPRPIEYTLAAKLGLQVENAKLNQQGEVLITFWPDGTLDEANPERVTITENGEPRRVLELGVNRLEYNVVDAQEARRAS